MFAYLLVSDTLCILTFFVMNILLLQPIQLLNYIVSVAKPGKIPAGKTEIPFELPLKPKVNKSLYETYHGVFVNIQVSLSSL